MKISQKMIVGIIAILTTTGMVSIKVNMPIQMTRRESISSQNIDSSVNIFDEAKKDFSRFAEIASDCFNYVVNGSDSKYENGIKALFSDDNQAAAEDISDYDLASDENEKDITLIKCKSDYVVDGDTLIVNLESGNQIKVRLIGIDTPESVHADESKNTEWGILASNHTKELIQSGQELYLEYDVSTVDIYGRTLAYVWMTDNTAEIKNMLNARLLSDGYACDKAYPPNNKYTFQFQQLRKEAQSNKVGLWSEDGFTSLWK